VRPCPSRHAPVRPVSEPIALPSPAVPPYLRPSTEGVELDVVVQPRASRSRLVGVHDGRLKIQLAAPPVDGEANAGLVALLSELFGIPRRDVRLARGDTGRRKTLALAGLTADVALRTLAAALPEESAR